ncbi:MAG TPA: DNA-directed RNA polymerase subunit alpha C-terminal domain-containing protein [Candidatus Saccharimonadales bacterium]|nr:DNA-directed RNA polymerase subunit alpha C-terminal domain-containing protein [Candidatus Saccharimonadales bacterium]
MISYKNVLYPDKGEAGVAKLVLTATLEGDSPELLEELSKLMHFLQRMRKVGVTATVQGDISLEVRSTANQSRRGGSTRSLPLAADDPIEELDLGEQPRHALRRSQIYTIGQLAEQTANDLLALPNFGPKSLEVVVDRLDEHGWQLKDPAGPPLIE